jgi:hypothetical protein
MANSDCGLDELLDLLKEHPELIKELVFNVESIQALLGTNEAKSLALGVDPQQPVDARTFLGYVAGPADGYAISQCQAQTTLLCAKGSRALACVGGTGTKPRL